MSLFVEIEDAAISDKLAAATVGVDSLDADAAALVIVVLPDPHACEIQVFFFLPTPGEPRQQIANAGFRDGVVAGLFRPLVVGIDRDPAGYPEQTGGMHAHFAVVLASDVARFLTGH